ncbi:inorganic phosphate transporter [Halonotius pteroides]|uniref:Phosphate transporter n=1 Tax=Halonotius pteroides TaxID=268735 RepID=A0A3A6QMY8_9EURY|nr:inorganic phosphate transporter [Halonotius pteroides]RJX49165.1 inorganic phosphate transporter [Halonotius pteroides]
MELAAIALFLVAGLASLFMAWVIGAGSSGATPFAPAVGANAIPTMQAAFIVGLLGFAGAITQGTNVSATVGGGLIGGVEIPAVGVIVILLVGAGLMAVGIHTGYPIATAFTVTGAVVGVGLAIGGAPAWETYQQVGAVWVLTPIVGGGVAYGIASVLPRPDAPETVTVPVLAAVVGVVLANVEFAFLGPNGTVGSLTGAVGRQVGGGLGTTAGVAAVVAVGIAALVRWDISRDEAGGLRHVLLVLGSLVAFSAGGSQVGLAVGPLLPLVSTVGALSPAIILAGGGLGILAGSWLGAPRMIKSLAQDYSDLGPRRSIAALVPAFLIAQVAVLLGVPVSFNEIIVSGIVGGGAAVGGGSAVDPRKLLVTVGAWTGSLGLSFAVGYGVMTGLQVASSTPLA